jgi:hypothetical protein
MSLSSVCTHIDAMHTVHSTIESLHATLLLDLPVHRPPNGVCHGSKHSTEAVALGLLGLQSLELQLQLQYAASSEALLPGNAFKMAQVEPQPQTPFTHASGSLVTCYTSLHLLTQQDKGLPKEGKSQAVMEPHA